MHRFADMFQAQFNELLYVRIIKRVENILSLFSRLDNLACPQDTQLVRHNSVRYRAFKIFILVESPSNLNSSARSCSVCPGIIARLVLSRSSG